MHAACGHSGEAPLPLTQLYRYIVGILKYLWCEQHMYVVEYSLSPPLLLVWQGWGNKWRKNKNRFTRLQPKKMFIIFSEERQGIYFNLYEQRMWHHCNSCPLKKVKVLFFYDMIYKAWTAVNIIDSVYDLVCCFGVGLVGFHHMAPSGHCSNLPHVTM